MDLSLHRLLVALETAGQARRVDAVESWEWTVGIHALQNLMLVAGGQDPFLLAQKRRSFHPPRYRLSMQEPRIAGFCFECVPKSMAEIQDAPAIFLFLVPGNNFSFDPDRIANHAIHHFGGMRHDTARLTAHQPEEVRIGDHTVLDDFEKAGAVLTLRQRIEHR